MQQYFFCGNYACSVLVTSDFIKILVKIRFCRFDGPIEVATTTPIKTAISDHHHSNPLIIDRSLANVVVVIPFTLTLTHTCPRRAKFPIGCRGAPKQKRSRQKKNAWSTAIYVQCVWDQQAIGAVGDRRSGPVGQFGQGRGAKFDTEMKSPAIITVAHRKAKSKDRQTSDEAEQWRKIINFRNRKGRTDGNALKCRVGHDDAMSEQQLERWQQAIPWGQIMSRRWKWVGVGKRRLPTHTLVSLDGLTWSDYLIEKTVRHVGVWHTS